MENTQKRKKKREALRILLTTLFFAAVIVATALFVGRGGSFSGAVSGLFAAGGAEEIYYEATVGSAFTGVGGSLAVLTPTGLSVYGGGGQETFSEFARVESPALVSRGKYGAAYDIGGKWLCFFDEKGVITVPDIGEKIISASVSDDGKLTVCSGDAGYLGAVTVYSKDGEAVYKWHSGSGYVLAAAEKGGSLAAVTLGEGGSNVAFYSLDSTEEKARWSYDGLVSAVWWAGKNVTALTDGGLVFLDGSGTETGRYDLGGRYLERFAPAADFTALVTGDYQLSADRAITAVDGSGAELGVTPAEENIADVAAAGDYIAVLYQDKAVLYGKDMTKIEEFTGLSGARRVWVDGSGRMIAAGAYSARICVPSKTADKK